MRSFLLSLLVLTLIMASYLQGWNDGFEPGVFTGKAESVVSKNSCVFKHNGVIE